MKNEDDGLWARVKIQLLQGDRKELVDFFGGIKGVLFGNTNGRTIPSDRKRNDFSFIEWTLINMVRPNKKTVKG